ncbi:TonB-dependent receptor [Mucilaginibacter limnophilus]|uniref:TonB-dependent receptor n=1 Tax=Mucilaginibacter limnophilus TaxID=1932778 RepID=A0A437MZB2_9SPHI|nr:TonB-dependent receptor [Mucilaginibacter limnophilus]RVU03021.1 TonB-dependent receptor [Mucilaginibacter limnophilus]
MNQIITKQKFRAWFMALIACLVIAQNVNAQTRQITGSVISEADKLPLPGVVVKVKGTTTGTSTNPQGNFTITAATGDVLQFTYVGFQSQEVTVGASGTISVSLVENIKNLDEVVVIGYGVQKKKLVTGANLQVKGEDLQRQNTTNALQALQGQAPGVQITSSTGQPGGAMRVVIRGLGTIANASPLYVVDGVLTSDITYLNPSDIESIDVLKDAASAAIYGSQSANGVVLVTTRNGKANQKAQISFDGFAGVQKLARKADLLNSQEYATIMNEAAINSGKAPYFTNAEVDAMGEGTDWLGEMFVNNARTQNYVLSVNGGSNSSIYSTSLGYTGQEGIVGGSSLSNYERYNFRINTEHKLYNDIIKIGQHLNFSYIKNNGIGVGNQYNNSLRAAFNTSPFVPMYDENGNFFDNSNSTWYNGESNPYAVMYYSNQNRNNNQRLIGDVYLSVEPIKGLRFRTSIGMDYNATEGRSFQPIYKLSIYAFNDYTRASQNMSKGRTIMWDNLLSYNFNIDAHNFEVLAGSSAFQYAGSGLYGTNRDLIFGDLEHAWLSNATNTDGANITLGGAPDFDDKRLSFFGRLQYNYKETYLLNATFRADGSSRFAAGHRWGNFPSVSAGWVATNEEFLKDGQEWLNFLKVRASWGRVGNQAIPGFQYLAPISFAFTNYIFGNQEGVLTPGAFPSRLGNPGVKWETSQQTDIGFDANFINNKLAVNFDYYIKDTKDWLINAPIPGTAGADAPYINGGNVRNTGVELALSYRGSTNGGFNYTVGVNGAYNKNKVGQIPTADGIIHGANNLLYDNSLEFYRAQNGFPIGYFWGLKTDGIFQNEAEVDAHRSNGVLIQPNAQPGDLRYVDLNGDGLLNDADRTIIGNPNPDYTFGFNFSADYKGFDFTLQASGVAGNDIVQSWRNHGNSKANYSAAILDRWHGEGSSTTMPRVTEDNRNWTQFSDIYIHKGDYLRINTITLGYDFGRVLKKNYLSKIRFYASVLNVYTFTKYNGMDPEIGYSEQFASGVDLGYYPRPRTFMIGANLKF